MTQLNPFRMNQQVRYISMRSLISNITRTTVQSTNLPASTNTITTPLKELPKTTGSGPFSSPVSFEVLGVTKNLLNIKLPKSSILNLRYSNKNQKTVALNGSIGDLFIELGKLSSSKGNLIFQRCFNSKNALSILLSNNSQNANFTVIPSRETSGLQWFVKRDALIAWSGNHLDLNLCDSFGKLVGVSGEGQFVLSSPGQLIEVNIIAGESISVNPGSLVAYSTTECDGTGDELKKGVRSLVELNIPGVSSLNVLGSVIGRVSRSISGATSIAVKYIKEKIASEGASKEIQDKTTEKVAASTSASTGASTAARKASEFFTAVWSKTKRGIIKLINGSNQDYFIEFKGPKTLLITNAVQLKDKVLTEEEISKLI